MIDKHAAHPVFYCECSLEYVFNVIISTSKRFVFYHCNYVCNKIDDETKHFTNDGVYFLANSILIYLYISNNGFFLVYETQLLLFVVLSLIEEYYWQLIFLQILIQ